MRLAEYQPRRLDNSDLTSLRSFRLSTRSTRQIRCRSTAPRTPRGRIRANAAYVRLAKFAAIDLFVLLGRQRCLVPPHHAKKMGLAVIERDPKRMNGRHAVLSAAFFDLDQ